MSTVRLSIAEKTDPLGRDKSALLDDYELMEGLKFSKELTLNTEHRKEWEGKRLYLSTEISITHQ